MTPSEEPISERDQLLVLFLQCLQDTGDVAARCSATRDNRKAIVCATYVASVLRDAKSVFILIKSGCSFSAPKLLRSIIESVVNVKAVMAEEKYIDYLVFESVYQRRKDVVRFRELSKTKKFRERISVEPNGVESLDVILDSYKKQWDAPYSIERKFQIAKVQYLYDSAYSRLSENVHVRLISLADSFQNREEGGPLLGIHNDVDDVTLAGWVEVASLSMVESVECLCAACDFDPGAKLQTLKWHIIQLQEKYFPDHCPEHYKE